MAFVICSNGRHQGFELLHVLLLFSALYCSFISIFSNILIHLTCVSFLSFDIFLAGHVINFF